MWFKKEHDFDEEKGDNDFDAGDDETSLSHDIKVEFEDTKEDLTPRSKLLFPLYVLWTVPKRINYFSCFFNHNDRFSLINPLNPKDRYIGLALIFMSPERPTYRSGCGLDLP